MLVAAIVAVAACGTGGRPLGVDLTDRAIAVDAASVAAGRFVLNIRNAGTQAHELQVIRTDLALDALPYNAVALRCRNACRARRSLKSARLVVRLTFPHAFAS